MLDPWSAAWLGTLSCCVLLIVAQPSSKHRGRQQAPSPQDCSLLLSGAGWSRGGSQAAAACSLICVQWLLVGGWHNGEGRYEAGL